MKKSCELLRRLAATAFAAALLASQVPAASALSSDTKTEKTVSISDSSVISAVPSYSDYLKRQTVTDASAAEKILYASDYVTFSPETAPNLYTDYQGQPGNSLLIGAGDTVKWNFTLADTGRYILAFHYYPVAGNSSPIIRDILIDDTVPFKESQNVSFERIWTNETALFETDRSGNQILPAQVEKPQWITKTVTDATGYTNTPLCYYLEAGTHTLTLVGKREPLLLYSITLEPFRETAAYADVAKSYAEKGYTSVSNSAARIIEAETASAKSDQTICPTSDRTSPSVTPYSSNLILYNTLGGTQWSNAGQWAEWTIDIPETGLYTLGAHFKQALKPGSNSIRELYIDGTLPFKEALNISFPYKMSWQARLFSDQNDKPYQFYLTKGKHTIRLQAGLGNTAPQLELAKEYLLQLNALYRKIVVITGTSPDSYRDYHFEDVIPDVLTDMAALGEQLKTLATTVQEQNNGLVQSTIAIQRLCRQIDSMTGDPNTIAQFLSSWKDNISAFGTWINDQTKQPLTMDCLYLNPVNASVPKGEAGFLSLAKHNFLQFIYSFISDYSSIGEKDGSATSSIRLWMFSGRDQAQTLKRLINNDFTANEKIAVNLQLVSSGSLLPAILAKNGPDVCIGLTGEEPLNLALRNGITNLSDFNDFSKIAQRFHPAALVPFEFNSGTWALPETQSYPVLFYRTDILNELGISVNELSSWDQLLNTVLPKLHNASLSFGLLPGLPSYSMFLYQYGGTMYLDNGRRSGLGTAEAIRAMKEYSLLYSQYGLNISFDFSNRFRSGEMPIAVSDFTAYNQLTVFAPEIKGLWNIAPVPGVTQSDGTINRTAVVAVTGSVILSQSKKKSDSWAFLKWWTSAKTQTTYGKEIESIVGAAARYNSANLEAFSSVQWDNSMLDALQKQAQSLKAIPQVPGGYFTARSYDFSFRDIVYSQEEVRETMLAAAKTIDKEIAGKREEYNLD